MKCIKRVCRLSPRPSPISTQSDTQGAHALDGQDESSIRSEPLARLAGQGTAG